MLSACCSVSPSIPRASTVVTKRMTDTACHPVLVHCRSGKHRTGCIVGCLRRLLEWPPQAIRDEYIKYARGKFREVDVEHIQRFFVFDLLQVLPPFERISVWAQPFVQKLMSSPIPVRPQARSLQSPPSFSEHIDLNSLSSGLKGHGSHRSPGYSSAVVATGAADPSSVRSPAPMGGEPICAAEAEGTDIRAPDRGRSASAHSVGSF